MRPSQISSAGSSPYQATIQFSLVALTQILGLSVWFAANAVLPSLVRDWGISLSQAAWLSIATQVGFALGAVGIAFASVLDRYHAQHVLGVSALIGASLTLLFALYISDFASAVLVRFAIGLCFAGIYPPGLKLTASWSLENRSLYFGVLGGCMALGSASPYLLNLCEQADWRILVGSTSLACAVAGLISLLWIRPGPYSEASRVFDLSYSWRMLSEPGPRAACFGYFGHMFELYAVWTWLPVFLLHSLQRSSITPGFAVAVFLFQGVGGFIGCLLGGVLAMSFGRERIAVLSLCLSGACCAISPFLFGANFNLLLVFAFIWGTTVIADSGLFSAMLSSSTDPRYVGSALSIQTAVGFLITIVTIQVTPVVAEAIGWQFAFAYLVIGPMFGAYSIVVQTKRRVKKS